MPKICFRSVHPILGHHRKVVIRLLGSAQQGSRVARWFVFKPKIQIWANFGGSCTGRCWFILWTRGPFWGHFLDFMDISYSLWLFGIFFPFWYFVPRKIWQPCKARLSNEQGDQTSMSKKPIMWPNPFLSEIIPNYFRAGLPDGIFSFLKSQFW
jgi:hypothetical protein